MTEAFFWGVIASSSLLIGGLLASLFKVNKRVLGLIMAFGVGVLISAVAYELVEEAFHVADDRLILAAGLMSGALLFFVGDTLIDRAGGNHRKRSTHKSDEGSGGAIVLGTIIDGIPESLIIGLTLVRGGAISATVIIAVFISNLPESIAASTRLRNKGWKKAHIFLLWLGIVAVSGTAALIGYSIFDSAFTSLHAFVLAFAGGAILTMITDTMMPEAYEDSGKLVGLVTTLGFCLAFALNSFK